MELRPEWEGRAPRVIWPRAANAKRGLAIGLTASTLAQLKVGLSSRGNRPGEASAAKSVHLANWLTTRPAYDNFIGICGFVARRIIGILLVLKIAKVPSTT